MPTHAKPKVLESLAIPDHEVSNSRASPLVTRKQLTAGERRARIFRTAYLNAERRGFEPGSELDDWLAAEREAGGAQMPTDC